LHTCKQRQQQVLFCSAEILCLTDHSAHVSSVVE
jgi:hypothetical protein